MLPTLRSDWLFSFGVFAEHLSFTAGAKALGLSQPALHVQISRLSEELGVPLYTRKGRALELTQAGVELLAFARESRQRDERFVQHLRQQVGHDSVVLASGEGAYLYLLGPALRAFSKRRNATLRLLTRDRIATVSAVLSGEAHLGVAALDEVPPGIVAESFATVQQVVLVPAAHPIARKRAATLFDLEGETLVVPPSDRPHRAMLASALAAAGVSWRVGAEANGWELLVHFAHLGLGLAVVNGFTRVPKGLVSRPIRGLSPIRYSLLGREGAVQGEAVAALAKLVIERAAVVPP
jgi:LysR family transcriptional regulator, low CO2-responsive transcriptional regulator